MGDRNLREWVEQVGCGRQVEGGTEGESNKKDS